MSSFGIEISAGKIEYVAPSGALLANADGRPKIPATMNNPEVLPRKKRQRAQRNTSIQSLFDGECG